MSVKEEPWKWNAAKIMHPIIASRNSCMEQLAKKLRTVYKGIYRYVLAPGNSTYIAIDTTGMEIPGAPYTKKR